MYLDLGDLLNCCECTEEDDSRASTTDAMFVHLDDQTHTIVSMRRQTIPTAHADRMAEQAIECAIELIDEEWGNPEGETSAVSNAVIEATRAVMSKMTEEHDVWTCDRVASYVLTGAETLRLLEEP